MKNNKFNILLLVGLASLSLVGCNTTDNSDKNNPVSDGGAYNEIEDEDVTSITVFKNDWADFNTARLNNTPIYSTIKNKINCDIEALNSSSGTWEGQLSLLQADGDLPNIFLTNGPDNSFFFNKLIRNEDILPISDWVSEEHYSNIYNYLKQFEFLRSNFFISKCGVGEIPLHIIVLIFNSVHMLLHPTIFLESFTPNKIYPPNEFANADISLVNCVFIIFSSLNSIKKFHHHLSYLNIFLYL